MTSGPWKLASYTHRERTVLVRNPYWFGVDRAGRRLPYLDQLVVVDVPEQNTANLKFQAGEVDALPTAIPENYSWYEQHAREGRFTCDDVGPSLAVSYLWFNLTRVRDAKPGKPVGSPEVDPVKFAWFNNVAFRRAVSKAIDRDAMIASVYYGSAIKSWSSATPGNTVWYTPDLAHDDYDPAEAMRLLAGLGFRDRNGDGTLEDRDGRPVTFILKTNSSNLSRVAMANFVRDDLAKVGIRVVLSLIDFNTFLTNVNRDYQYDAAILGLAFAGPDPVHHERLWRSSSIFHQWNNLQAKPETPEEARIDSLLDVMARATDQAKRMASWRELQGIANERAWLIWLPAQVVKIPVRDRIGNMRPTGLSLGLAGVAWNSELLYVRNQQ